MAHGVDSLPTNHKTLSSNPSTTKIQKHMGDDGYKPLEAITITYSLHVFQKWCRHGMYYFGNFQKFFKDVDCYFLKWHLAGAWLKW
jgi:hypothetical protein